MKYLFSFFVLICGLFSIAAFSAVSVQAKPVGAELSAVYFFEAVADSAADSGSCCRSMRDQVSDLVYVPSVSLEDSSAVLFGVSLVAVDWDVLKVSDSWLFGSLPVVAQGCVEDELVSGLLLPDRLLELVLVDDRARLAFV